MKREILRSLQSPLYKEILPTWLQRKAKYVFTANHLEKWQIPNVGDKVLNILLDELAKFPFMPAEFAELNPYQRIFDIKSDRLSIEWFADYLLSIKTFKTYVNSMESPPDQLEEYHYLLQLLQVVKGFESILTDQEKIGHFAGAEN